MGASTSNLILSITEGRDRDDILFYLVALDDDSLVLLRDESPAAELNLDICAQCRIRGDLIRTARPELKGDAGCRGIRRGLINGTEF